ncbi:hypothetical protein ACQEU8_02350 [Streptomyces sp. CA-250714]|uniref:hypothetical protein n=1 Tax=Streptomyces sp. CA-250714 TaxID=3240060 RepID=UPI003D8E8BE0
MAIDYKAQLVAAVRASRWNIVGPDTLNRVETRDTPEGVPEFWWPEPTYTSTRVLKFLLHERGAPSVFYTESAAPWTQPFERKIPFRRALELLAE